VAVKMSTLQRDSRHHEILLFGRSDRRRLAKCSSNQARRYARSSDPALPSQIIVPTCPQDLIADLPAPHALGVEPTIIESLLHKIMMIN
jgi:CRP-like cAMP-binding protein